MSNLGLPCLLGFFHNCNDNLSNIIIARTVIKKMFSKNTIFLQLLHCYQCSMVSYNIIIYCLQFCISKK